MQYDVIVVGAGPSGSIAAEKCAKEGLKVALLEKADTIGTKVCAGGLEPRILHEFDIDKSIIETLIQKAFFHIVDDKDTVHETKSTRLGATTYRSKFDRYLSDRAVEAGADLFLSSYCQGVVNDKAQAKGVQVFFTRKKELVKLLGDVIVAADGFNSIIVKSTDFPERYTASDVALAIQYEVSTEKEVKEDAIHLFYGDSISKIGYGWIFPKKKGFTVGVGCLLSLTKAVALLESLERLMALGINIMKPYTVLHRSKLQASCIPLKPRKTLVQSNILVVGDAAGQVSIFEGAGIYYGMAAGRLAAKVIVDATSKGDFSEETLKTYEVEWTRLFGEEMKHQRDVLDLILSSNNPTRWYLSLVLRKYS